LPDTATAAGGLIRPFAGIRPTAQHAADVAAPPYDVMSVDEARAMAGDNPWSFLHISRPEIDLPAGTDVYAPEVYQRADLNMRAMLDAGVLVREPSPAFYVYRAESGDHRQTGLVFAASLEAYRANRIRRHELTRPDKETDRTRQIDAIGAQTGPVMVVHRADADLAALFDEIAGAEPEFSVTAEGGVRHTLWAVRDDDAMARLGATFDAMEALYIADGHHRSAAASRVADERGRANPDHRGDEPYNFFLAVSFPDDEVRILDYNRVVRDLGGHSAEEFLAEIGARFTVEAVDAPARPDRRGVLGMYVANNWYRLSLPGDANPATDPLARLDVNLLSTQILDPVLGIRDVTTDPRIDFVGGIRGLEALADRVDSNAVAAAFALYPTDIRDLFAVADAGLIMPPKSTWFEPKLADGLISYSLE